MTKSKRISPIKKRAAARGVFFAEGGSITMEEIGAKVGLSRQSVAKYRMADGWDAELSLIAAEAKVKAIEVVTDKVSVAFDRHLSNLEALDIRIEELLAEKKLNPVEVSHLARAAATIVQTTRLLRGESTTNTSIKADVRTHDHSYDVPNDQFQKVLTSIVETGCAEGQQLLSEMIVIRQKIMALTETF